MEVNFIECSTLDWVLIREEKYTGSAFWGTTYTSPHIILGRLSNYDMESVGMGGSEIKRYIAGIYRTKDNEKW